MTLLRIFTEILISIIIPKLDSIVLLVIGVTSGESQVKKIFVLLRLNLMKCDRNTPHLDN